MKLMLPTVYTDGSIDSDFCVKAKRPMALMVAQGSAPLDLGQDISRRRRLLFSGFAIVRKAVISRAPEGGLYGSHVVDGLGSVRE